MTQKKKMINPRKVQKILVARINELCKEKGMSYYNLSYESSVPLSTVTHIMDGTSKNPGIFTIMKICDGFGITMQEFFDTKEFEEAIAETRE